jgi:MFS family permease
VVLHASALQVGLLTAATTVSFLLIALPAGVVVDRIAKRKLMISCDAARMLIIGSVPVTGRHPVIRPGSRAGNRRRSVRLAEGRRDDR